MTVSSLHTRRGRHPTTDADPSDPSTDADLDEDLDEEPDFDPDDGSRRYAGDDPDEQDELGRGPRRPGQGRGGWQRWLFGPGRNPDTAETPRRHPGARRTRPGREQRLPALTRTRLIAALLWATVALGPVLGIAALSSSTAPTKPTPAPPVGTGPQGFAELYVSTWLGTGTGTVAALAAYYPPATGLDFTAVKPGHLYAGQVIALDTRQVTPGYWSVTVGADVLAAGTTAYTDLGVRYYTVGVLATGPDGTPTQATTTPPSGPAATSTAAPGAPSPPGTAQAGYVAAGLPTQVAAPARLNAPVLGYTDDAQLTAIDPVGDAVTRFLQAYLCGTGEVARYATASAALTAVTPAPYTAVTITNLAHSGGPTTLTRTPLSAPTAGRHVQVLAAITGTDSTGATALLHYPLSLVVVDGRWEVSAIAAAPALAADTTPEPATSPAPMAPTAPGQAAQPTPAGAPSTAVTTTGTGGDSDPNF